MVTSIALVPTLMIMVSLILGIAFLYFESISDTTAINKYLNFALVHGADNARMILTTIVGGIISLTVFSFSMVMVVLNRASASLSPRVLPQLVAQKFHQFVLGFYMGTIVYSLILVVNVDPEQSIPSLGILLGMILAICSLGLFIYFIHSISQSIQADNVLKEIYKRTLRQIKHLVDKQTDSQKDIQSTLKAKSSDEFVTSKSGFYQLVNVDGLVEFLRVREIKLEVCIFNGQFVHAGEILANFYEKKADKKTKEILERYIYFASEVEDDDEFYFGLRKISEIAVKALSPGINDPGTALKAIRLLSMLFADILQLRPSLVYYDEKGESRVYSSLPTLELLLFENLTPIRQYSAGSLEIINALFGFFNTLLSIGNTEVCEILFNHVQALINTSSTYVNNQEDMKIINKQIITINQLPVSSNHQFSQISFHKKR